MLVKLPSSKKLRKIPIINKLVNPPFDHRKGENKLGFKLSIFNEDFRHDTGHHGLYTHDETL